VLVFDEQGRRQVRKKEFPTYWQQLQRLKLWLYANQVQQVAMESTGVYWKPVWNILQGHFPLLVTNPYHMKNIPGRKTDQNDAEWIADLLAHGLLRGSFIPPPGIQELRDWTRYRVKTVKNAPAALQPNSGGIGLSGWVHKGGRRLQGRFSFLIRPDFSQRGHMARGARVQPVFAP